MKRTDLAFSTPMDAPGWKRWLVYSPLARIIVFVIAFLLVGLLARWVMPALGLAGPTLDLNQRAAAMLLREILPAVLAYAFLVGVIERRRPAELSLRGLLPGVSAGLGLGALLFIVVMGVLWLAGSYHVDGTGFPPHWLALVLMVGPGAGIAEEIMFRGVLFRIVEEGLGTWAGLLVSALAFGAVHLGNPHATVWSGLAIAIEAGVLFALVYHVTRSLWLCMGLHAAWNVMEGPVFGASVSGLPPMGWVHAHLDGPAWLSGGTFGPENSLVTVLACVLLASGFLVVALRRGSLVPPFWRRARHPGGDSA